jgi:GNAT superfamily N-acetyltransferase
VSYELASYEPAQREDYLRLLREAWGPQALQPEEFDWWFDRNPAGSLRSVARANGSVVGVAGHTLLRMVLGGEERLASFSVHATSDPAMRGQGIFRELERKHEQEAEEQGAAVVLAFASAPTAPIFLGPLGWTEIARLGVWARPAPRLLRPRAPRDVAPLARFEHAGDAAAAWPNHVVRDARHLSWRYLDSPKRYSAFGGPAGYAVLGHKVHRGVPVALVADLAGAPGPLLRACLAAARPGARAVLALPAPDHRGTYLRLGFVPTPMSLHLMGKGLADKLDVDPSAWRFTLGDTDFF